VVKQRGVVAGLVLCLIASVGFAARLWSWVLNFDPGFAFTKEAALTGPPLTAGVTLVLVDGLRLDASRRMPTLNALRERGADIEARVGTPSFSRPGRATIAVGAPPDIHGVTTNRQRRKLSIDNLFRMVGAIGGTCRVAGSTIWPGLFGDDVARCGVYQPGEGKEGPGAFVRQVGEIRAGQEKGLEFILQQPADLRIADVISTDFAAHEYGGASAEYLAEVARADRYVAGLVGRLDLSKETLVVTADHGHRDVGGHGGEEPEVLAIPIVMAGAGILPSTRAIASQADIAPTIAALLGLALPAGSSGRPMVSVLAEDDGKLDLIEKASALQETAFDQAVAARLGHALGEDGRGDWLALLHAYREAEMSGRVPLAVLLTLAVVLGALFASSFARPGVAGVVTGLSVAILAFLGCARWLVPPLSLSAINYDELLIPFFSRIMLLAALATAVSVAFAVMAARFLPAGRDPSPPAAVAGVTGLLGSAALVLATIAAWLHHGLLLPLALPGPDQMVKAYALSLSTTSVALTSLVAVAILSVLAATRPGAAGAAPPRPRP
jgi:hypothetical protein